MARCIFSLNIIFTIIIYVVKRSKYDLCLLNIPLKSQKGCYNKAGQRVGVISNCHLCFLGIHTRLHLAHETK